MRGINRRDASCSLIVPILIVPFSRAARDDYRLIARLRVILSSIRKRIQKKKVDEQKGIRTPAGKTYENAH